MRVYVWLALLAGAMVGLVFLALATVPWLPRDQTAGNASTATTVGIDMDPTGNTATSVVTIDRCAQVAAGSSFDVDVFVDNILPVGSTPNVEEMAGFQYALDYPGAGESPGQCGNAVDDDGDTKVNDGCDQYLSVSEASIPGACDNAVNDDPTDCINPSMCDGAVNDGCPGVGTGMTITAKDHQLLIAALPGAEMNEQLSDVVPDSDGEYIAAVVDFNTGATETNPPYSQGLFGRYTISVDASTPPGVYDLGLRHVKTINYELPAKPQFDPPRDWGVGVDSDKDGGVDEDIILDSASTLRYGLVAVGTACPGGAGLEIPDFKQCDSQWNQPGSDDDYDHLNASICRWGCALTSLADVLNYHGVDTDPKRLNDWLKANGGYVTSGKNKGAVVWARVPQYASQSGIQLAYGALESGAPPASKNQKLAELLGAGVPVIAGVPYPCDRGICAAGHYVVVTGRAGSSWSINDPGGLGGATLDEYAVYGDVPTNLRWFRAAATGAAKLVVRGRSPIEFLVTDPLERRTGYDPASGQFVSEIPGASYGLDQALVDQETGESLEGIRTLQVDAPSDGAYALEVIATADGRYTVDADAYDQGGGASSLANLDGVAAEGVSRSLEIDYSSTPGSQLAADCSAPPAADADGDGLANDEEPPLGTDACDADTDDDAFYDGPELYVGTDPLDGCPDNETDDAWPVDIAIDGSCDVADIMMYRPYILQSVPPAPQRYDLAIDQYIDVGDILMFKPFILTQCTNPP